MKKYTTQSFIEKARFKHGDKYDYSKIIYTSSHDIVTIGCPNHGWFVQKAYQHLNYGCNKCGDEQGTKKRRTDINNYILRANEKHAHRYSYEHVIFNCQHDLIEIVCPVHGIFKQAANDHLKGRGCEKCGVETRAGKRRGTLGFSTEEFIQKAISVHGNKYSYEKTVYQGSNERTIITCHVHGEFQQSAQLHLQGCGCLKCGLDNRRRPGVGRKQHGNTGYVLFEEFEERAREIHGEKYDYVHYSGLTEKVSIICPEHGLFRQKGNDHIFAKANCPLCARDASSEKRRYSKLEFEDMLYEKWEGAVTLYGEYHDLTTETEFRCFAHGDFSSIPYNTLQRKHACHECWDNIRGQSIRLTQNVFEKKAHCVHNNKYQYGIFTKTDDRIIIECPIHGLFSQNAGNHLAGNGCPSCGVHKTYSQNKWLDMLGIEQREIWFDINANRIKADGYDPKTNTIYEFWGDFWHGNPHLYHPDAINTVNGKTFGDLYERTLNKRKLITTNGFKLIEIWENDWRKISEKTKQR